MQVKDSQESIWKTLLHDPRTKTYATVLSEFPDLVKQLDDMDAVPRWTLWVPCEQAMKSEIQKTKDWTAEAKRTFVEHLISPYEFPAEELFYFPNVPTIHHPQRLRGRQLLRFRPIFRSDLGPTYAVGFEETYILIPDIKAMNGRMHILSGVPPQPPTVKDLLRQLPDHVFSILHQAMDIANFDQDLNELCEGGCTMFVPTDTAFHQQGLDVTKLGTMDANRLKRLLKSHIAPGNPLYSNILYDANSKPETLETPTPFPRPVGRQHRIFDSAVPDRSIRIDIDRNKGLIEMRVNKESQVISMDHLASDGVVHVVDRLVVSSNS